jgi:hypothetical protein
MGTSTVKVFGNDTAADIRDALRDLLADGLDSEAALAKLLDDERDVFEDDDERMPAWLGLAEALWDLGRLTPSVKERALALVESGEALAPFERDAPRSVAARRRELERFVSKLDQPQPPAKIFRPRRKLTTELERGDLFAYTLPDGRVVLLLVTDLHTDRGGTMPELTLLDGVLTEPPSGPMASLPAPAARRHFQNSTGWCAFLVTDWSKLIDGKQQRWRLVQRGAPVPSRPLGTGGMGAKLRPGWGNLGDAITLQLAPSRTPRGDE